MDEPSLQKTLREKYNINELLLAEGRFVGLIGDHAINLLCLGLGIRYLAIARVILSADAMDYELLSLIPLKILSLSYQNLAKKIKIRSQFKPTQIYQLCTSANQAEIWDNLTSTIREVYMQGQGDIWCSPTLQPSKIHTVYVRNANPVDLKQSNEDNAKYSSVSTNSCQITPAFPKYVSKFSESSESLPTKLPSHADDNNVWFKDSVRSQSMVNIDTKFDNFVNDASIAFNNTPMFSTYDTEMQNILNNFNGVHDMSNTDIFISQEKKGKQDGRLISLYKRVQVYFNLFYK